MPTAKKVFENWFKELQNDEDCNVFLEICTVSNSNLVLQCGQDGYITLNVDNISVVTSVTSGCTDKFVETLVENTNSLIFAPDYGIPTLNKVLGTFTRIIKDANEDDMDCDGSSKTDGIFCVGNYVEDDRASISNSGNMDMNNLKKRLDEKESEVRSKALDKALCPGITAIKDNLFSSAASKTILVNDLTNFMQRSEDLGFELRPIDDDIYNWKLFIRRVRPDCDLHLDLINLDDCFGYSYIELNLSFAADVYPFYPPLVTIVRPRLQRSMLSKIGMIKCLQLSQWDPISSTFLSVVESIRKV